MVLDPTMEDVSIMVSVCMITYGHEQYIEEAILSILDQETTFNYEFIISNDASPDATDFKIQHILSYHPKANKIRYIKQEHNIGMTANFIYVLGQAKGTYVAYCEGDDYWTDSLKLQKQVDFLEAHPEYSLSFTRFQAIQLNSSSLIIDNYGRYFKNNQSYIEFDFDKFTAGWPGGTLTLMYRNDMFDVSNAKKYIYFRDIHLYTELLKSANGVCLNFFSAVYREHQGGIYSSATLLERAKIASMCYKEIYALNKEIPELRLKYIYFKKNYINQLLINKFYIKSFIETLKFGFYFKNIQIIINGNKKIIKYILFSK